MPLEKEAMCMSLDRKETLIAQIKERQRIKDSNISRINREIDELKTQILNIDFLYSKIYLSDSFRQKFELEKQIMILEKEKREEEIRCWRDIASLE